VRLGSVIYPFNIKSIVYLFEVVQELIVVITCEKVSRTNNSQVELLRLE